MRLLHGIWNTTIRRERHRLEPRVVPGGVMGIERQNKSVVSGTELQRWMQEVAMREVVLIVVIYISGVT